MTATVVDGKKVEAAEPTKSPLWTPSRPIFFLNCMELLLADGSTTYGCRFCDYTDVKMGRIRTHQTNDCKNNPNPPSKEKAAALKQAKRDRAKVKVQKVEPEPDIFSMLEAAFKPSDEDKAEVERLTKENATLTAQRDKVMSVIDDLMDVLQKHGFLE